MDHKAGQHPLRCRCGTVKGYVSFDATRANRGICYCKDCRAFAHFLGRAGEILDDQGGTDVVATVPRYVTFTQGEDALACMSLTPQGLLRWYASCCNTPIGNTPRDYRFSYVGLVHSCLEAPEARLDDSFGPARMRVNTRSAKGKVQATPFATFRTILRFMKMLLRTRLEGSYRNTPFFSARSGEPVKAPKVLERAERDRLRAL